MNGRYNLFLSNIDSWIETGGVAKFENKARSWKIP